MRRRLDGEPNAGAFVKRRCRGDGVELSSGDKNMDKAQLDGELKKIFAFCKENGYKDSPPLSVATLGTYITIMDDFGIDSESNLITGLKSLKRLGEQYEDARDADDAVGAAKILEQGHEQCRVVANWVMELGRTECAWTNLE